MYQDAPVAMRRYVDGSKIPEYCNVCLYNIIKELVGIGSHHYMKPANQDKEKWPESKRSKWSPYSGGRGADQEERNW
jgi:hypothetical protein